MSASLNRIVLCGNLTADPELSYTPSGMAIAKLRLAVNERVKNQQGEWVDRPCYVDVTAFGGQAEASNKYLEKGSPILLEGKLRYETWEAKDGGGKRSKHSVVADRIQFLSTRSEGGAPRQESPSAAPMKSPKPPMADSGADEDDLPPF
ncbi:single-stranded DNA-binding protein [Kiritimatiellota bacterium B12222]|nr:single-stranded DNA-binding protein [Kiritimatiellota bacterium B12222]